MPHCTAVTSLAPLSSCTNLKMVSISRCTSLTSVEPLMACAQLKELRTGRLATHLHGLEALKAAVPQLRVLTDY